MERYGCGARRSVVREVSSFQRVLCTGFKPEDVYIHVPTIISEGVMYNHASNEIGTHPLYITPLQLVPTDGVMLSFFHFSTVLIDTLRFFGWN